MKKSLFAVAALSAIAGAAQAQSSVTVYGLLDVGYVGGNTRAATGSAVNKATNSAFSSSAESTSRLGFKGTEDLGGGTSAFFTVELGLNPNSGAQFNNTSGTQNRQTFAGLKKNGLGQFAIGTQYTIVHNAVAATDPGQANNMAGNLIYPADTSGNGSVENSTGAAYAIRTNNQLSLNSDTFAGFQANGMLVMNNVNRNETLTTVGTAATATGGMNNQSGWGLGVNYTLQKFYATANYQAFTSKQTTQTTNSTGTTIATAFPGSVGNPVAGYVGGSSTAGQNVQDNQWYLAATYDFGILKAYAQYINRKVTAQQNTGYYMSRTAEQIGVRSYITPTIEAWASGGLGRYTTFGGSAANMTAWQIGSNYWLSKRTNLYAIYGMTGTSNVSIPTTFANNGTGTGNPVSGNVSNYAVGLRHTF